MAQLYRLMDGTLMKRDFIGGGKTKSRMHELIMHSGQISNLKIQNENT